MISKKKHKNLPLFSPNVMRALDMRVRELIGYVIILCILYVGGALGSYSSFDSCFNTATSSKIANLMGRGGALVADLFIQLFNRLSWLLLITFLIYGCQIIEHKSHVITLKKIGALILSLFLGCIVFQSFYTDQVVALTTACLDPKGGVIGLFGIRKIYALLNHYHYNRWLIPCILLCLLNAVVLWKYSVSLTFKQIFHSIQKVWIETFKLIQKVKIMRRVPPVSNQLFQEDQNISFDEDTHDLMLLDESEPEEEFKSPKKAEKDVKKREITRSIFPENSDEYQMPSVELLQNVKEVEKDIVSKEALKEHSVRLLNVLSEFGIAGEMLDVQPGPVVTMYEFRPAPGIKTSRVISLADDIARSMSALSARIATIPGKNAIGIELPNHKRQTVYLRPLLLTSQYRQSNCCLPLVLGKDISGGPVIADLTKMPHLLVAGTTGSGKSVSINTMILSLLYQFSPAQCKFIMVDPKMLELSVYDGIPHLLTPVVTDPKKAIFALKWAVREMETRYRAMSRLGVRNIDGFNRRIQEGRKKGDVFMRRVQTGFDSETGKPIFEDQALDYAEFPYIVVVVDEMADLMLVAGKEIEAAVQRLAQMARAAGIHLIMATQRPSVDVITGTIKANFPTRISFQVTSKIDSRTILGEQGAEHLLGHGDMLYMSGGGRICRVHGPFVSDAEVECITQFLKSQGEPEYVEGITEETGEISLNTEESEKKDDLFQQAVDLIREEGRVSISFIQRRFQIGYNKAARIVEQMEKEKIVSSPDRTGKRELL